jgi:hypothetical protein
VNHDTFLWQFGADYPGAKGNDAALPIGRMLVKGADGAFFMSTFDSHPAAVDSFDAMRRLREETYGPQGIHLAAWAVPHGIYPGYGPWPTTRVVDPANAPRVTYAYDEGVMHGALARMAAAADEPVVLTVDLEPFYYDTINGTPQYWRKDLGAGPEQVRQYLDGAQAAGVQFVDIVPVVRRNPFALWDTDYAAWLAHPLFSRVCPQLYWNAFGTSPEEAYDEMWTGLARVGAGPDPGRIRPVFRVDAPAAEIVRAWEYAERNGLDRPLLYRRGIAGAEQWETLVGLDWHAAPTPPAPAPGPDLDAVRRYLADIQTAAEAAASLLEGGS